MQTPKVRLYIRVRLSDGRHSFLEPAWNRNHTLRAGYALAGGQPELHPEAIYYLRYLRGAKSTWQAVGPDPNRAMVALRNTQHDLEALALGRKIPDPASTLDIERSQLAARHPAANRAIVIPLGTPLTDAIATYMAEVRRFRAPKTIAACQHILTLFESRFPQKTIQTLTRKDLLDHMSFLIERGLGQRTVYNHIARISTFLRANKITGLLAPSDKPRYDEKAPAAYECDQLNTLLAAATPEERILFAFFLGTGFREQEVMYPVLAESLIALNHINLSCCGRLAVGADPGSSERIVCCLMCGRCRVIYRIAEKLSKTFC